MEGSVSNEAPKSGAITQNKVPQHIDENFVYAYESLSQTGNNEDGYKRIDRNTVSLFHSFGFSSHKRSNVHFIEDHIVLSSIGNVLIFLNLKTNEQNYLMGPRDASIGAIAVHPSRAYFAVAEVSTIQKPCIFIFKYPSLEIYRILRNGSEKGFSDISFNSRGDRIGSVGMDPDYTLAIWHWKDESTILRSKAFSQDVYRVAFSPDDDGVLTTSGMGHIKFWRMSSTFTGLKLQGYTGKFGATELSDIASFVYLSDGKILSSTETGNLLLWDGGSIKCEIGIKGRKPCHQGRIEAVIVVEGEMITAGEDGYVRIWDLETIENADVTGSGSATSGGDGSSTQYSQSRVFEIEPIDEILIGKDVKIKSILKYPSESHDYLIQDQQGHLFRLDISKRTTDKLLSFHSGPICSIDTSPIAHLLASTGLDGSLRMYDYTSKTLLGRARHSSPGRYVCFLPEQLDASGATVAAGFEDGVLRITAFTSVGLVLQHIVKPHKAAINYISVSSNAKYLATCSSDKNVFFFQFTTKTKDDGSPLPYSRSAVHFHPVGFITLDAGVRQVIFAPDGDHHDSRKSSSKASLPPGTRFLLLLADGRILSGTIPHNFIAETTDSFEISLSKMHISSWKFSTVKQLEQQQQKNVASSQADSKPKQQPQASEQTETTTSATNDEVRKVNNEAEKKSEPVVQEEKGMTLLIDDETPSTYIYYLGDGYFLNAIINKENGGELRLCHILEPTQSRLLLTHRTKITSLQRSSNGTSIFVGCADGRCYWLKFKMDDYIHDKWPSKHECIYDCEKDFASRIEPFVKEFHSKNMEQINSEAEENQSGISVIQKPVKLDVSNLSGQYWFGFCHDATQGAIHCAKSSFDDSFFASSGDDGGLFVWRINDEKIRKRKPRLTDAELEDQMNQHTQPDDITDASSYSLQEQKIKSEKDKEIEEAEMKKQAVRNHITELRNEFFVLLTENTKLATNGIGRADFKVDPFLRKDIESETLEKINIARKELAWISEKEMIGPKKLRERFFDCIQTERIIIKAFQSEHWISTFRTLKSDANIEDVLTSRNGTASSDLGTLSQRQDKNLESRLDEGQEIHHHHEDDDAVRPGVQKKAPKDPHRNKLEMRKQMRAERAIAWKELMNLKPDDSYEDPNDVAAISYAQTHMGDYKLKSAPNYVVPEAEMVDADKKKRQIILLKESINSLKEQFNASVIKLRSSKQNLLAQFQSDFEKIRAIDGVLKTLGTESEPFDPKWNLDQTGEFPENKFAIDNKELLLKRKELSPYYQDTYRQQALLASSTSAPIGVMTATATTNVPKSDAIAIPQLPPASKNEDRIMFYKFYRNEIISKMKRAVSQFDAQIDSLSIEKLQLEADLKFGEMKLLVMYQEWALLKEFEKSDTLLQQKMLAKTKEKQDIDEKILECQDKLTAKKSEIDVLVQKGKDLYEQFLKLIGENNKNEDYLLKVFKKKIKRSKKKIQAQKTDEEDEDEVLESDDDELSFGSDLDEEEDDEFEEKCPQDCDPEVWSNLLLLREERLDHEEVLVEISKTVEALKKENDSLVKKEKVVMSGLKAAENEIREFQSLKQGKLNELDVVVPLYYHQIEYLEDKKVPKDLSPALVFTKNSLSNLQNRILELQNEKRDIKRQHKDLKRQHISYNRSKKEKNQKLQELDEKAYNVQMLKFGQIIDLDKLEKLGINKTADELRDKLAKEDMNRGRELAAWEAKVDDYKEKLLYATKDNTIKIEKLATLKEQKVSLEEALNNSQKSVTAEYSGPHKKDVVERQKLIQLVQSQAAQIEALKQEIENLIRKPIRHMIPNTNKQGAQQLLQHHPPHVQRTFSGHPVETAHEGFADGNHPKESGDGISNGTPGRPSVLETTEEVGEE